MRQPRGSGSRGRFAAAVLCRPTASRRRCSAIGPVPLSALAGGPFYRSLSCRIRRRRRRAARADRITVCGLGNCFRAGLAAIWPAGGRERVVYDYDIWDTVLPAECTANMADERPLHAVLL